MNHNLAHYAGSTATTDCLDLLLNGLSQAIDSFRERRRAFAPATAALCDLDASASAYCDLDFLRRFLRMLNGLAIASADFV